MPSLLSLADRIDAILPQTQCTKCGYDGCRPYAQAIAQGQAPVNRCPPGGQEGTDALAALLGIDTLPLDATCGAPLPARLAIIDESHCIGCTLCIQACPVDAIIGANKRMHTVLPDQCTGCDLCVDPCPVDCITMVPDPRPWSQDRADTARAHHQQRQRRLAGLHREPSGLAARTLSNKAPVATAASGTEARKQAIADALARARARRQKT